MELGAFRHNLQRFFNLHSSLARLEAAAEVFDELASFLGSKVTFFGPERDLDGNARTGQISSLDLEAYVYLKEMLTNTPESKESKYFVEKYKTLLAFVAYTD